MNEAQRIVARGRPVTLIDGQVRHLRFGMRQNDAIENQFGSMGGFQEAMSPMGEAVKDVDEGDEAAMAFALANTKMFSVVGRAVACGLVARDFSFDDAWDSLDEQRFPEYTIALFEALSESNPQVAPTLDTTKLSEEPDLLTEQNSPGMISTISPQSYVEETMKVS